jgi:hypothetical protein
LVENDGDHPTLFGDYAGGNRVERVALAVAPAGAGSPWAVGIAGDLIYADPLCDLGDGDVALRATLAGRYADRQANRAAVFAAFRHQRRENDDLPNHTFHEELALFTFDANSRLHADLPGHAGWLFGEWEAALRLGSTSEVFTLAEPGDDTRERILAYGAVARLGTTLLDGPERDPWGKAVATLEWGYASGDADPYDGTSRRFDFNPNHNVGLILFDEVLAWKTARAATLAADPTLMQRPLPGSRRHPSNGAVFGATYLYPNFVFRPVRRFDVRLAMLVAQTTADLVDPVRLAWNGTYRNYDGGASTSHDLGLELDAGVEYRHPLQHGMNLQLGAQGGVLFPGNALSAADGTLIGTQYIGVGRLGLLY